MTRPDWDLPDEWEVARRATCAAWVLVRGWRFATWWVRVERTEKEER